MGVKSSTCTAAAVYAVRKVAFVLHRKFALIKYLRKLLKSNDCILIYCYVKKFDGVENHKKNSTWCLMLKNWLIYLGFNEIWHAQMQWRYIMCYWTNNISQNFFLHALKIPVNVHFIDSLFHCIAYNTTLKNPYLLKLSIRNQR